MNASRAGLATRLSSNSRVAPRRVIVEGSLKRTKNGRILAGAAEYHATKRD
jgi:hypothetical protein